MIIAVDKVRITTKGLSSFQMFTHHPQISNTVGAIPHFVVDIIIVPWNCYRHLYHREITGHTLSYENHQKVICETPHSPVKENSPENKGVAQY